MKKTTIVLSILIAAIHFGSAQPSKFPPPNDLGKDKSLVTFVNQLKVAVQKKDKAFILSILYKNIKNGFLVKDGIKEFKKQWNWSKDTLTVWHHLQHVLNIGGGFTNEGYLGVGRMYVFPYVFNIDPGEADIFSIGVITGKNVNFQDKPNLTGQVITQLTYDVVEFSGETHGENAVGDPEWYQIETADHKKGWVFWQYVYSPSNYRFFLFKNKQGKWKITAFLGNY